MIPVLLLSACSLMQGEEIAPQLLLTPYVTKTSQVQVVENEESEVELTPTPTLTPTPFPHVLAVNETISSLALTYGLEINEILAINPEITPNALSVGTQILIPHAETISESVNVISEPLALEISQAECVHTAEGGLWCSAEVLNSLEQDAAGITVAFTLRNNAGELVREQTVPAVLNYLKASDRIPASAYFSPSIPAVYSVTSELATALPAEESALGYLPINIKVNSVDVDGRTARISALIPVMDEESGVSKIWVVLMAYDEAGQLVGIRKIEYSPITTGETGQTIKIFVYSNSKDIKQVNVLGEAVFEE